MMTETLRLQTQAPTREALHALWQAARPAGLPPAPPYPLGQVSLVEHLDHWARLQPDATAIEFYGRSISWARLRDTSLRLAAFLVRQGIAPGDRVAVFLPNCPQFAIAFFAILRAGAVHVPVSPLFKAAELAHELTDSGARAVVVHDDLFPLLQQVLPQTRVTTLVATGFQDFAPVHEFPRAPAGQFRQRLTCPGAIELLQVLEQPADGTPLPRVALDDVAAINYTGGTTGLPKGCVHTHRHMLYTAATTCCYSLDLQPGDAVLNFFPLYWIAGEDFGLIFPVFAGATCVLLSRWDAHAAASAIERHRIRIVNGLVETALDILALPDANRFDLRCLEMTLVSSFVRRIDRPTRHRWRALTGGGALREASWGMTETHTWDAYTRGLDIDDRDLDASPGWVGLPVPGTEFKIIDFHTGEPKGLGDTGQLCVRSPSLFNGYWGHPKESAQVVVDGWLHTGDIGLIDDTGHIHYLGRQRDMLKVKGVSVFPAELEAIIGRHPAVAAIGVVGQADAERGEVPVAMVELRAGLQDAPDSAALEAWCRDHMAVYKLPRIRLLPALPRTSTGKIDKLALRAMAA